MRIQCDWFREIVNNFVFGVFISRPTAMVLHAIRSSAGCTIVRSSPKTRWRSKQGLWLNSGGWAVFLEICWGHEDLSSLWCSEKNRRESNLGQHRSQGGTLEIPWRRRAGHDNFQSVSKEIRFWLGPRWLFGGAYLLIIYPVSADNISLSPSNRSLLP